MRKFLTKRNIIIALLLAGALGWWWYGRNQSKNGKEVKEAIVTRGEVVSSLTVSGEIKADKKATLNYSSSGKVAYLGIKEGDEVKKGQVLSYLDMGDLDAASNKAYYTYIAAEASAKKVEDDMKNKGASETFAEKNTRIAAQTTRDIAYDAWLAAQRAVKNARLVAPFAGVVTSVSVDTVGDTASITDGITMVDPASLYFSGEVDEQDIGKVIEGQEVTIKLDAFEGKEFKATVGDIGFESETSSTGATVFPVKLRFAYDDLKHLRIGMNGDARIVFEIKSNVLRLPFDAVDGDEVVIRDGDKEKTVTVGVGLVGEDEVEIVSGLNEGDKVLVK